MLRTILFRRGASLGSSKSRPLRSLNRQLLDLKRVNHHAEARLRERRRLLELCSQQHHQKSNRRPRSSSAAPDPDGDAARAERQLYEEATHALPRNTELESAIAFTLTENRDARAELELIRRFIGGVLLSLASPVGPWDPYDVKPQVFALDRYLALPVFTSIEYLRIFCQRFGFTTRDPSGVLWASGGGMATEGEVISLPRVVPPENWGWRNGGARDDPPWRSPDELPTSLVRSGDGVDVQAAVAPTSSASHLTSGVLNNAEALFDVMGEPEGVSEDWNSKSKCAGRAIRSSNAVRRSPKRRAARRPTRGTPSLRKARRRRKLPPRTAPSGDAETNSAAERADFATAAFWEAVARVRPFNLKQATPLPTFGPFVYPHFIGYFADVDTLLHNASIVPEKVDLILNPFSPLEMVLAREATDRVLHHDQLLALAYKRVEKQLCLEFHAFFSSYCPEVRAARSACLPRPLAYDAAVEARAAASQRFAGVNALQNYRERTRFLREAQFSNGVAYDLVILLESDDFAQTYQRLRWGKQRCLLLGHVDLDVLPEEAAAPHVREAAQLFFTQKDARSEGGKESVSASDSLLNGFRKVRGTHTVNVAQSAESFYHDPTNAYTEADAVFTEELKICRDN
ncbi:unnamed protein product [Phytomonas sp. EM1]|nr:unnamed protein product [Phytomonas sp. EM1]|eukprot:CCW59623.1 unnamed protein product [Phytomonas sp. isolate EM1]